MPVAVPCRRMPKPLAGAALALGLALLLAACAPAAPAPAAARPVAGGPTAGSAEASAPLPAQSLATAARPEPPIKVRLGGSAIGAEAGYFVAMDKGYFAEEGIDVEFLLFQRGSEQIPP